MDNYENIQLLIEENNILKCKINQLENELNDMKKQIEQSKQKTKTYYENNKEKIIERVKEYNKTNNYKPVVSSEKKKEYNKLAYLKKKEKDKLKNEQIK